jgi:hypothetical protein
MLKYIANDNALISTVTNKVFHHPNIQWIGHQSHENWMQILLKSKFLIGLGHPLLGPSAIDAIAMGCVYLNPIYDKPLLNNPSQHHYADTIIGSPRVCSFHQHDIKSLETCLTHVKNIQLQPFIPQDFRWENYLKRVIEIFNLK